ncbi:hypothetical protein [Qipengyuania atrilutea]|uniref:Glycosyl transferase n=1 Tax=Qipengyuania atrilutea TaxID=2744473 RepID=A0A850H2F6_9SPHN|nr:hypothetical protein [Actirhodobacter atriluteus]NVD44750.1 hypothetical protein [Actirhodobacter atriluteus]
MSKFQRHSESPRIFDAFDSIRIINLPERKDRRSEMESQLAKVNLLSDPRVRFFDAIRPAERGDFTSVGAHGVYESHKRLLAEAASDGHSLLILEDDCDFTTDIEEAAATDDWDIFYGGYNAKDPSDLMHSDIEMAHMMGFSARGARLVSEYLENLEYEGIHPPIDAAYIWYRRSHPETPTYFAVPPIGVQRSSASDIAPRPWDRFGPTRMLAGGLRKLRTKARS